MDEEELVKRCQSICLAEEEDTVIELEKEEKQPGERMKTCRLDGKVLSSKHINRKGVSGWLKIEQLGANSNKFMFQFKSKMEYNIILKSGPWSFDKALIVLVKPTSTESFLDISVNRASFWIQVHNIPLGGFLRVRVNLDIRNPLKKGLGIRLDGKHNERMVLPLRYLRPPEFCFRCGHTSHLHRECAQDGISNDHGIQEGTFK